MKEGIIGWSIMRDLRRIKGKRQLTDEENEFIRKFIVYLHAPRAAQEAGSEFPYADGHVMMNDPVVVERMQEEYRRISEEYEITPERTLSELAFLAYSNMADYRDADGQYIPLSELPRSKTAAIRKMGVTEKVLVVNEGDSERLISRDYYYELYDKRQSQENLMRYHGHFERDNRQKGLDRDVLASILATVLGLIPVAQRGETIQVLRRALGMAGENIIDLVPETF